MKQQDTAIEVKSLTKTFGTLTAVDHISFDVGEGEFFGFLGPNGAGKTTTIGMLTGIIKNSVPANLLAIAAFTLVFWIVAVNLHCRTLPKKV